MRHAVGVLPWVAVRILDIHRSSSRSSSTATRSLADPLDSAYGGDVRVFGLDVRERELLLCALGDTPPKALAELRSDMLQEHVDHVRDGLA